MVRPLLVLIYLSEDCRRVSECFDFPTDDKAGFCNCNRAGKRELGPRKNADRHGIVFRRSEPTRAGTEVLCGEFVTDLCRPGPDVLEAVVTHCGNSLLEPSPMEY